MPEKEFTHEQAEIIAGYAVKLIEDYKIPLFEAVETAKREYRKLKSLERDRMLLAPY